MNIRIFIAVISTLHVSGIIANNASASEDLYSRCAGTNLLGSVTLRSSIIHSAYHESTAFALVEDQLLYIADLSDPTSPTLRGSVTIPAISQWREARVNNDTLYIFDQSDMLIIDIADLDNPTYINTYQTTPDINCITIHNNHLYIGTDHHQLVIIDLTNPHAPSSTTTKENHDGILTIINGVGYTTRLQPVDLFHPNNPIPLGAPSLDQDFYMSYFDGQHIFLLSDHSEIYDLSDPLNPSFISDDTFFIPDNLYKFTAFGSFFYDILFIGTATVFDYSNLLDPVKVSREFFDNDGPIFQIYRHGQNLFLTRENKISTYARTPNPQLASHYTNQPANDLILTGNTIVTACDNGLIQLFDISENKEPRTLSTLQLPTTENALAIDHKDHIAYIATRNNDLNLVDFSDTLNPTFISNIDSGLRALDVKVINNALYVLDRVTGLSIYDISIPTNPLLISSTNTVGAASTLTIDDQNNIAYIAYGRSDLQIIDISNSLFPITIGSITPIGTGTQNTGILTSTLSGSHLYTAEGGDGYRIFDVSDPSTPIELAHLDAYAYDYANNDSVQPFAHEITIEDNTLYLASGSQGLTVFDNTDPFNPTQTNWAQTRGDIAGITSIRRIHLRDNIAFGAVYEGGLRIYDLNPCSDCPIDFNNDSTLNFFDVSAFISALQSEDPAADLNTDGRYNFFDISQFLTLFSQGCP